MGLVTVSIQRLLVMRNIDLLFLARTIQQLGTTNRAASAVLCVRSISTRITLLFTITSTTVINAIIVSRCRLDSFSICLAIGDVSAIIRWRALAADVGSIDDG